jgi:periplasmic protein CpxP/Spy
MKQHATVLVILFAASLVLPMCAYAQAQSPSPAEKQEMMAKLEKMSTDLQLSPQQKKQMAPILMEEAPKMKAIKSNTSLGPMQKAMQMKQVGQEMDAKVKPILSSEQYAKYEQMRAQEREQMMEKMRNGQK